MKRSRFIVAAFAAVTALSLTACAGGSSDTVGAESGGDGSGGTINLYAYAVPKVGFDSLIPAFEATDEGEGVVIDEHVSRDAP